ncbi:DMT family transporter [Kribbella deserti]|uniref:DMT family transporter n=1 Tax=Kribbella deserti TaxID=1926257 RepID=A0ABV6QNX7_9ACTN
MDIRAAGRVAILALLWGSTYLWIELALEALSPAQVTFSRCAIGAVALLAVARALPKGREVWRQIVVAAFFCNALPYALFSIGQQTIDSGLAGVLNATTPLWSLVIGLLIGTERGIRPVRVTGLLLGFAGTALILQPWQQGGTAVGWGALAILGAALSYAISFAYMGRKLAGRGIPTISLSAAQLVVATGFTGLALPFGGFTPVHLDPLSLTAIVVLGVVATATTFHLTYRIIAAEGATNAATVGYLLPVVSVALGSVVLGEQLGSRVVAGMLVVLLGVALTRHAKPTPSAPHNNEPTTPLPHAR